MTKINQKNDKSILSSKIIEYLKGIGAEHFKIIDIQPQGAGADKYTLHFVNIKESKFDINETQGITINTAEAEAYLKAIGIIKENTPIDCLYQYINNNTSEGMYKFLIKFLKTLA